MFRTREGAALAVVVSFLILLLTFLLSLADRDAGKTVSRPVEEELPPAEHPAEEPATTAGRVHVELLPVESPVQAPAPTPEVARPAMTQRDVDPGAQQDVDPGAFPEIVADYRRIGFDVYTRLLSQVGARFFVVRKPAFTVVTEVDPVDFAFVTGEGRGPVDGLSPRSRDISTELRVQTVLARAAARFGSGQYGVIVLLPLRVERRLMAALDEIGRVADVEVDSFVCAYRVVNGALALQVAKIRTTDGLTVTVNRLVNLDEPGY